MPHALLLHGLSAAPASWWRVREWLETDGWTVASPALLGHDGRPPAPRYALEDVAADVARHAPPEGAPWDLVVGHSLGGAVATLVAAEADWTRRLVLLDPVLVVPDDRVAEIRADQLAELELSRESFLAASPGADARDVDAKLAGIASVDPAAVSGVFDDTGRWDVRRAAERLAVPTLVLAGDPAVFTLLDPADAAELERANPRIAVRRVAGAGHGVHRDRPEEVRAALAGWLAAT